MKTRPISFFGIDSSLRIAEKIGYRLADYGTVVIKKNTGKGASVIHNRT